MFLHPLALFGLAVAAIPALLHLFERRQPPEAEFPPPRYLAEAERESARLLKLRHLLLLLLRTALMALVVLAAARPLVPARIGGASAHAPTALVVIFDNSPSSGVVVDGRPMLDRLRAVARPSLAATSPADHLWLVLADGVLRRGSRAELLAALDSATVGPRRLDLSDAVARATQIVQTEPLAAREVHVVSDLQRTALGETRVTQRAGVRVLVLGPMLEPPPNRGIGAIAVANDVASVSVVGTAQAAPGAVTVRVRGATIGHALAAPGSGVTVPLPPLGVGWWVGDAALDPDELRTDDRRLFVWRKRPPARVRTVGDVGPFVRAALGVLGEEGAGRDGGAQVAVGERPGAGPSVVFPPIDRALIGETNRALRARGVAWRFGERATPGPIAGARDLAQIGGVTVAQRYRLERVRGQAIPESSVLATVNGDPWVVRDSDVVLLGSRLDTAWTALPAATGFVPFLDALVNRIARGEAPVTTAEGPVHVEFHTRGRDTLGATVYGPDPRESDLTPAPPELVERALGVRPLDASGFSAARFAGTRRADISGWLLGLALLVAAAELGVATRTR